MSGQMIGASAEIRKNRAAIQARCVAATTGKKMLPASRAPCEQGPGVARRVELLKPALGENEHRRDLRSTDESVEVHGDRKLTTLNRAKGIFAPKMGLGSAGVRGAGRGLSHQQEDHDVV